MGVQSICVFCGSSLGNLVEYQQSARKLGHLIGERGMRLVYGGASVGLMGVVADACMEAGGVAVGVMPQSLVDKEIAHLQLNELHVVNSMHERKAQMAELSDGFIAMPGGFGTFEEFFEIATWTQLGIQLKSYGLLNVAGYYDHLLAMADHAVVEGFLKSHHREMLLADKDPEILLDKVLNFRPTLQGKWIPSEVPVSE